VAATSATGNPGRQPVLRSVSVSPTSIELRPGRSSRPPAPPPARTVGRGHRACAPAGYRPRPAPRTTSRTPSAAADLGQPLGLVGADRHRMPCRAAPPPPPSRRDRAGYGPRSPVAIGLQQHRIGRVDLGLGPAAQPGEPQPQHRPPAMKRRQASPRPQQIARAQGRANRHSPPPAGPPRYRPACRPDRRPRMPRHMPANLVR
jgi:hypothetical protein